MNRGFLGTIGEAVWIITERYLAQVALLLLGCIVGAIRLAIRGK